MSRGEDLAIDEVEHDLCSMEVEGGVGGGGGRGRSHNQTQGQHITTATTYIQLKAG
jgi:hypothetical protein